MPFLEPRTPKPSVGSTDPPEYLSTTGGRPARRTERAPPKEHADLTPEERAAFLLHDVFDYGYGEVAEIVGKSEANARQLATRARRHVAAGRPRFETSEERRR